MTDADPNAGRVRLVWDQVRYQLRPAAVLYDDAGDAWAPLRTGPRRTVPALTRRGPDGEILIITPDPEAPVWIDPCPIPEPPDGTRLELEHDTDLYAMLRNDEESRRAGWTDGDGGEVWMLYGHSVPATWTQMWIDFGTSLLTARRLLVDPETAHLREQWPTQIRRRRGDQR